MGKTGAESREMSHVSTRYVYLISVLLRLKLIKTSLEGERSLNEQLQIVQV
jgi:hypothetical protein